MKKSFTLMELIIVIVIMGILGTISIEILQNTFQGYIKARELNKLALKTDLALNLIASKLQNRIKNSVIAVECNASLPAADSKSCIYDGVGKLNKNFVSISDLNSSISYKFPVIEWLYVSLYSRRGMWDKNKKFIQPGWSGFVDLKATHSGNEDEYNITSPDSNFSIVQQIDGNWTQQWGINGYKNVFENNITALVFSGSDGRGDIDDINNSYGYYGHKATRVFAVKNLINYDTLDIKAFSESNSSTVYEGYYLVRGAMSIVPVYNSKTNDYNLTLRFNYFPWKKNNSGKREMYMDGNSTLLVSHVTQFKFKEEGGVIRLYLCVTSPEVKLKNYNLTLCKEKVVF